MEHRHRQLLLGEAAREEREIVQVVDPPRLAAKIAGLSLGIELVLGRGLAPAQAINRGVGGNPVQHGERRARGRSNVARAEM